jgi:hypothetical protein
MILLLDSIIKAKERHAPDAVLMKPPYYDDVKGSVKPPGAAVRV